MHITQNPSRKILFAAFLAATFIISACGDDSSGSSSVPEESLEEDSELDDLEGDAFVDSSLVGEKFSSSKGSVNIIKSELLDSVSGMTYKTIQFGPYTWMAENAKYNASESTCYDEDSKNCTSNGRLYQGVMLRDDACPEGFDIPVEADYQYMKELTGNLADPSFGFNPQMSGYCEVVNGSLTCSGQGSMAYLYVDGFDVFTISSNGSSSFTESNFSAYYALRCMKLSHFVETEKLLPVCDSTTYKTLGDFYVAEKGKNYYCEGSKWLEGEDNDCPYSEDGDLHYYKDTLFVCDGSWEYASMNDVGTACTDTNQWTVQKLNGQNYICDDSSWRVPNDVEIAIGLCSFDAVGKLKNYKSEMDTTDYYCDSTGWRPATLSDSIGVCDEDHQWAQGTSFEINYLCENSYWRAAKDKEDSIGFCTPSNMGKIDSLTSSGSNVIYYCDSTGWRYAVAADVAGQCDSTRTFEEIKFLGKDYVCRLNGNWTTITDIEKELGVCTTEKQGSFDTLGTKNYGHVCDTGSWRVAEIEDYYGECDSTKYYTIGNYKGSYYGCTPGNGWSYAAHPIEVFGFCLPEIYGKVGRENLGYTYTCDSSGWRKSTIDEALGICNKDSVGLVKNYWNHQYGCKDSVWKAFTAVEDSLGMCYSAILDSIDMIGIRGYICRDTGWTSYSPKDMYGYCDYTNEGKIVLFGADTFVCKRPEWVKLDSLDKLLGVCVGDVNYTTVQYGDDYYYCSSDTWKIASANEALQKCVDSLYGTSEVYRGVQYHCSEFDKWRAYTYLDTLLGLCTSDLLASTVEKGSATYVCVYSNYNDGKKYAWRSYESNDELFGICDGTDLRWLEYEGEDYVCNKEGSWSKVYGFWGAYTMCDSRTPEKYGKTVGLDGQHYYCNDSLNSVSDADYGWYAMQAIDSIQGPCYRDVLGDSLVFEGSQYYCGRNEDKHFRWLLAE